MKFALVHLSGSRRGETQYFDRTWLTLGSDPSNDLWFPATNRYPVAATHAEILEADCQIRLRNRDQEAGTLVNHEPVAEVELHDQDLIQLGRQGPKLRFRIHAEEYAACKLVHEMLQDARDVAAEGRLEGRRSLPSFLRQLTYDVRKHASRTTQLIVVSLLVVLVGLVGGLAYFNFSLQRTHEQQIATLLKELQSSHLTVAELEQKTTETRRRMTEALDTRQAEIDRLAASLEERHRQGQDASSRQVQELTRRLEELEKEGASAEVLIERYGPSVCFLYIAFHFVAPDSPAAQSSALLEYMGTGFLADDKGLLVTNRHILEPWSMPPSGEELMGSGLEPVLVKLLAYFPGRPEPYVVSPIRLSDEGDVGLGRLSPVPQRIEPIPLLTPAHEGVVGEAVVLVGYPVGVEGLLARLGNDTAGILIQKANRDLEALVQELADQGNIRPLATQGHIGDIVPGRMLYDALTTGGGSGSPVFNSQGELIAVNAGRMIHFTGANYGVPVRLVLDLLPLRS